MNEDDERLLPPLSEDEKANHRAKAKSYAARRATLERRIVTDPTKLNGAPHIAGTKHTVAMIRAAYKEPGVLSHDVLKRFRGLEADDVEAALFHWPDPDVARHQPKPGTSYIAEWDGPPRRRIYLYRAAEEGVVSHLWKIDANEINEGETFPLPDALDEGFATILEYLPRYAPRDIAWRDEASGEVVDIYALKEA